MHICVMKRHQEAGGDACCTLAQSPCVHAQFQLRTLDFLHAPAGWSPENYSEVEKKQRRTLQLKLVTEQMQINIELLQELQLRLTMNPVIRRDKITFDLQRS